MRLHFQCKICGKVVPLAMLRFHPTPVETRTADLIQDPDMPPDPYINICRNCWVKETAKMKRPELLAIIEMLSCDLQEVARHFDMKLVKKKRTEKTDEDLPF